MSTVVKSPRAAFSLLELAVVLVIVGLVTAMAVTSGVGVVKSAKLSATQQKITSINQALQAYRTINDRLPCPASNAIAEGATNFGVEAATPGTCTGGTPTANYSAVGTVNISKTAVEGSLPVVTLGLPNEMMYDGWGNRFRYAVDAAATATRAFTSIPNGCTNQAITVRNANNTSITDAAIYAIVSHGENGHGAFTRQSAQVNTDSTNTSEQLNCHCDNTATDTAYTPVYVQKDQTTDPTDSLNSFDDIVSYKERWQMLVPWEKADNCTNTYVYVLENANSRVQKFDTSGNFLAKWGSAGSGDGQFNNPYGIAVDADGNVWVADTNNQLIQKLDSSGNYLLQSGIYGAGDGEFDFPVSIVVIGSHVYVGDHNNNRVQKFDLSGNYVSQYDLSGAPSTVRPWQGLGATPGGNFVVFNSWIPGVEEFNPAGAGSHVRSVGSWDSTTTNGHFLGNTSGTVDADGNYWIVDSGNNRIQKFNSSATWLFSTGGPSPHTCGANPAGSAPACAAGSGDGQFDTSNGFSAIAVGR